MSVRRDSTGTWHEHPISGSPLSRRRDRWSLTWRTLLGNKLLHRAAWSEPQPLSVPMRGTSGGIQVCCLVLLFQEDVWDVLFGFSLLANDLEWQCGHLGHFLKKVLTRVILSDNQLIMLCPGASGLTPPVVLLSLVQHRLLRHKTVGHHPSAPGPVGICLKVKGLPLIQHFQHALSIRIIKGEKGYFWPGVVLLVTGLQPYLPWLAFCWIVAGILIWVARGSLIGRLGRHLSQFVLMGPAFESADGD